MSDYPRESVELVPFTVTVDGTPVLTGVQGAIVASTVRPTAWVTPTLVSGKLGLPMTGLTVGIWDIWAQVNGYAPETPVIFCGSIKIT